ncbi:MAG: hypothetical protein K0Q72_5216 [Armatimonadetes bacterium]|jgi:hypothetical protein|nr:hypothetical protein [Armatimonadota bacterium]
MSLTWMLMLVLAGLAVVGLVVAGIVALVNSGRKH